MRLRPPQAEALREVRDALIRLPKRLALCTPQERREYLALREGWRHPFHPTFTLALATGIGKTRLAGAIIALLWLADEARVFLVLAPRRAVLRRFESALDQNFREYIFVDPNLVPEPNVVRADEIDSPRTFEFEGDLLARGPKIFLLSPQLIASSDRFVRRPDFAEQSPLDALRARGDVVVIADEAHHIGKLSSKETTAWSGAIRDIAPALQIGMTATPRKEPGEYVLYEYPLRRALQEGLYTKDVHICVRQFSDSSLNADDVDRSAILYSLDRLERKVAGIAAAEQLGFPRTKPVCVFFARDIEHAGQVVEWVEASGRVRSDEILVTHSATSKSEEEIEKLLGIEKPENPVRVVVNVMELMEGWDVTNVYVVTPLRAMATFQGALQAMGRGLRLPAGHRVDDPVVDELDVVCFGKEALAKIVAEATDWAGTGGVPAGLKVTSFDKADPVPVSIEVPTRRDEAVTLSKHEYVEDELQLELHPEALNTIREAVITDIELASAQTRLGFGRPKLVRERFVRAAAVRVIRKLGRYLSDAKDLGNVERLVSEWLDSARPGASEIDFDPAEVGEEIARVLEAGARIRPARYETRFGTDTVQFPAYRMLQEVMIAPGAPVPTLSVAEMPVYEGKGFARGQLYRGWKKALHLAYAFDSEPEALLAKLLDSAPTVVWWVRNHPARFRLQTPAGEYRPDFLVLVKDGEKGRLLVLEAKGDHLWKDPLDDSRLKSSAANEWAEVQSAAGFLVSVTVALESEIRASGSLAELESRILQRCR
jgi:superfamily II DNA or RNA helicase